MMFSRNVGVSEREIYVHHRTRISWMLKNVTYQGSCSA